MSEVPDPHDHQPHTVRIEDGKGPTVEFVAKNYEAGFFDEPCVDFTFSVEADANGKISFSHRSGLWGADIDAVIDALTKARNDAYQEAREYGWQPESEPSEQHP
ncbi:hypothetical protein [Micromonospora arborensis]|uniref:hypothetical protein n=1 Tax=Micromonospora arborensis TaxID=2116518 RepID=UPI003713FD46